MSGEHVGENLQSCYLQGFVTLGEAVDEKHHIFFGKSLEELVICLSLID